jgi:hypothetical protein
MNTENKEPEELQKCSNCKCKKLLKFFKIRENTGKYYRTCIKCNTKFKCNKCEFKCSQKTTLDNHIKMVHDKIKDFECDLCEFKCSTKGNLDNHIKSVHDKIKDFECDLCEFKCSQKTTLDNHIKSVHDKIKDWECDKCDYKCSHKGALDNHIKSVHDKIKDWECNKCDYKCSRKGDLDKHIKIVHDKIKDFECDKCDYKCSQKSTLDIHIKSVHDKIKDWECDKCDYKCSQKGNLDNHIKYHCKPVGEKMSSGEFEVYNALTNLGFKLFEDYVYNIEFEPLTDFCDKKLRFDFRFLKHKIVIEYDGEQHFRVVEAWGGKEKLNEIQEHDKLKNSFCEKNDYIMIRLNKSHRGKILSELSINLDDIIDWYG